MKAKKILAGACASLMLAMSTVPTVSAAGTVKVTVGNDTVKAGGSFSVTIDLAEVPTTGINACDFGIEFDSSVLTVTKVTPGALAVEETTLEGVSALETNIESGLVSVIYGLADTSKAITKDGTFLTIEGTVSNTAAAKKYDLKLVAIDRLADPSGSATNAEVIFANYSDADVATLYTPTITDGYVEVTSDTPVTTTTTGTNPTTPTTTTTAAVPTEDIGEPSLLGDVDCNGEVAAADITMLAKYLASKTTFPLDAQGLANADVTRDKAVNALDTAKLVEYNLRKITKF